MTKPVKTILKPVPVFTSGADERAYWEAGGGQNSIEHLDWSKARKMALPNLKPMTQASVKACAISALSPMNTDANSYKNNSKF